MKKVQFLTGLIIQIVIHNIAIGQQVTNQTPVIFYEYQVNG